jgi:ATP-binding cassette, subfamily G (WHITE), member 2, PDR
MGFECPPRQTTADFLTSLSNPAERIIKKGWESRVPRTADEFAARWKESTERQQLLREIEEYEAEYAIGGEQLARFRASRAAEQSDHMRPSSPYTISVPMQVRLCVRRGVQRLKNDAGNAITTIFGNISIALIIASVFYNLNNDSSTFFNRGSLLFFSILCNAFSSQLEIQALYQQRPIVEKHAKYALYHPFAEAIASTIVELPSKVLVAIGEPGPICSYCTD